MNHRDLLADLSRRLGDPVMEAALLSEGNTSARDGGHMLVKASGAVLGSAQPEDFVRIALDEALRLIDDEHTGGADIDRWFDRIAAEQGRRPSVEALLHAVLYDQTPARVIAHSHPTAVNALLCSEHPELLVDGALFPDQIVVLGAAPLLVPYIDPGLPLAREVRRLVRAHAERHGRPPATVYLQNHGMFVVGANPDQVLGMTAMAQKCARAIIGAAAVGGVRFMPAEEVQRIDTRPDEVYRRALLAEGVAR
ncbi:class II aldolase/adducin family protein [Microbacterium sp. Se5.02b]|uniref:class II aldolase/adducin family protein n=1 Tax=Microbacterium sp. Se5.02b TaxID=2864103 RepID=UPI001C689A3A|nr:class II aldolase/adducin family protein [Microbacterium sp. Se5.02b]QYM65035.1 class II aldolase/adducin family protein [Microbacterium sp. Se5.02b]